MKNTPPQYGFIDTMNQYTQYLENLPKNIPKNISYLLQMRFPAITAADGNDAYICIIPDENVEYTLLRPYNLLQSHLADPRRRKRPVGISDILQKGILHETGRRIKEYEPLGSVMEVKNSQCFHKDIPHRKHMYLIPSSEQRFLLGDKFERKSGKPIWVHNSLLRIIFEEKVMVKGEEKDHPQIKTSHSFNEWLKNQGVFA